MLAKVYSGLRLLTVWSSTIHFVVGRYVWRVIPSISFSFPCCMFLVIPWFGLSFHIHVCYLIYVNVSWNWVVCFNVSCVFPMSYSYWFSVLPTYELSEALHFGRYMLLEFILFCGTLSQSWLYKVLVVWKAMFKLVHLKVTNLFKHTNLNIDEQRINGLNPLYTLANITMYFDVYSQFSSRPTSIQETPT